MTFDNTWKCIAQNESGRFIVLHKEGRVIYSVLIEGLSLTYYRNRPDFVSYEVRYLTEDNLIFKASGEIPGYVSDFVHVEFMQNAEAIFVSFLTPVFGFINSFFNDHVQHNIIGNIRTSVYMSDGDIPLFIKEVEAMEEAVDDLDDMETVIRYKI